jgi:hypothetical protein
MVHVDFVSALIGEESANHIPRIRDGKADVGQATTIGPFDGMPNGTGKYIYTEMIDFRPGESVEDRPAAIAATEVDGQRCVTAEDRLRGNSPQRQACQVCIGLSGLCT